MKTMKQALMQLLLKQWVTPLAALEKVGCMSLSQRCGEFSANYLAEQDIYMWRGPVRTAPRIISKWVKLPNGKRVKAYRAIK